MQETSARYPRGCPTGSAVITTAGDLTARHVIHAVGPIWQGGIQGEAELLSSAYRTSFELAIQANCNSIALPALSTGAYRYPIDLASRIALSTALEILSEPSPLEFIQFVRFDPPTHAAFAAALEELTGQR